MTAEILQEGWRHEGYTPLQVNTHTQSESGAKDGFLLNRFLQLSGGTGYERNKLVWCDDYIIFLISQDYLNFFFHFSYVKQ